MLNWLKKQLTEPTAWICFIILVLAIFTRSDWFIVTACIIGIMLDEEKFKTWCNEKAPGISKWFDELLARD